jgi:prepilin-type N-terminal cleavage/methylation domain-containing protein
MKRQNAGFTLVEMLIVIAIFGFILAGTSDMFISMLRTHRQQSRITETNIEGIIGLELLRQDLEKAGFGLPWNMGGFTYSEDSGNPHGLNDAPSNPPRGIVSADGGGWNSSDYLVIRAANVATNKACGRWTFLDSSPTATTTSWSLSSDNFDSTDRVIIISPGAAAAAARTLISSDTQFSSVAGFAAPISGPETRIVYGIATTPTTNLSRPFNRADYFVTQPSSTDLPKRCALGTGILYKAVANQGGGGEGFTYMPLLDCVADMQVIFRYTDNTGNLTTIGTYNDISGLPGAAEIRSQVKEARVFILAHEGQKDTSYHHPVSPPPHVGDPGYGRDFNFSTAGITDWQNYRWKIYTLVVRLDNLN